MLSPLKIKKRFLGRLGDRLLSDGAINDEQLRQALERQRQSGGFLGEILVGMGFLTPATLRPYLEDVTGFPFVDISEEEIDPAISSLIPEAIASSKKALPFREKDGKIYIAMADPLNLTTVDEIKAQLDKPVVPCLALTEDIDDAVKRTFDVRQKARTLLDKIKSDAPVEEDGLDLLLEQAEEAPIVRLVNNIIVGAVGAGASDIHIEPQEGSVRVRYRIDGVLYDQMSMPRAHLAAVTSRLKVMSELDISERRRPQDGRFQTHDDSGHEYDVRLSIMPTVHGEKSCMRLLEKSNSLAKMDKLGFLPEQRTLFERFVKRPHGLILVTGPTGSGKSTTLYAALQSINDTARNINTIEDPVEYKLAGVNQVQVNAKIGLTFANGLRTLVRQDPDVILVGEIRDKDTAEIAIQAALTGHLVLSTLHTNDAPGALVRLQNMGVEPFLISSAVVGVVGQRLLRTICPNCRETYLPPIDLAQSIGMQVEGARVPLVARGRGCKRCGNRGMRGRTAACEVMSMTDELRELVLSHASGAALHAHAIESGMVTMREAAIKKALDLTVTPEEIMRVFSQEE